MFYVKAKLSQDVTLITEVHDDNIFTRCAHCGKEIDVYLPDVFSDEGSELDATAVLCQTCGEKLWMEVCR